MTDTTVIRLHEVRVELQSALDDMARLANDLRTIDGAIAHHALGGLQAVGERLRAARNALGVVADCTAAEAERLSGWKARCEEAREMRDDAIARAERLRVALDIVGGRGMAARVEGES